MGDFGGSFVWEFSDKKWEIFREKVDHFWGENWAGFQDPNLTPRNLEVWRVRTDVLEGGFWELPKTARIPLPGPSVSPLPGRPPQGASPGCPKNRPPREGDIPQTGRPGPPGF